MEEQHAKIKMKRNIGTLREKHIMCESKEEWVNERCTEIEQLDRDNQQKMFEKVGEITSKIKYNQNITIKKKNLIVATELNEVKDW